MLAKFLNQKVSIKLLSNRTPIIGVLKGVDKSTHGAFGNLIVEDALNTMVLRGDHVIAIAIINACPYIKNHNPHGFSCSLMRFDDEFEACEFSAYKSVGYEKECLTYQFRHLYMSDKPTVVV